MSVARRPLLMLSLATTIALICAGFNFVVDPYGAWGTGLVAPAFGKINDDRLQIPYLLRTSAPETVLVGSSRVAWGIPIEEGYRDGLLNAGIRGASLPQVVRIIDLALAGPHLKRLVWFVDFFAFSSRYHNHDPHFDARMDGSFEAKIEETLLSLNALGDSYDTLKRALGGRARLRRTRTVPIPWPMDFICHEIDIKATSDLSTVPDFVIAMQLTRNWYADYQISPALVRLFSTTVQHARAQGVEVVPVIAPMSQYELEFLRQSGQWQRFQDFKRMLAANGPFWDFAGYNAIARSDKLFRDATHMKPATGEMVLRMVMGKNSTPATRRPQRAACSSSRTQSRLPSRPQDQRRQAAIDSASRYARIAGRVRDALAAKNPQALDQPDQTPDQKPD